MEKRRSNSHIKGLNAARVFSGLVRGGWSHRTHTEQNNNTTTADEDNNESSHHGGSRDSYSICACALCALDLEEEICPLVNKPDHPLQPVFASLTQKTLRERAREESLSRPSFSLLLPSQLQLVRARSHLRIEVRGRSAVTKPVP